MKKRTPRILAALAFAVLFSAATAYATVISIEFQTGAAPGAMNLKSSRGNNAGVYGLALDKMVVRTDDGKATTYDLYGTNAKGARSNSASLKFNANQAQGNFITISGGVTGLNLPAGALLSGSFLESVTTRQSNKGSAFSGSGTAGINLDLLAALGFPTDVSWKSFDFAIAAYSSKGLTLSLTGKSLDPPNAAVPEPATLLLIGSGLVALALFKRSRS